MPNDSDDFDEFAGPPQPAGGGGPSAKTQLELERGEAWRSWVLDRKEGAKNAMMMSALYRRPNGKYGRARRILSPLTGKGERHRFDQGDAAHIVGLFRNPLADTTGLTTFCGIELRRGCIWSGIRAHSTCHVCLARATLLPPSQIGWQHKLAETQYQTVKAMLCLPTAYNSPPEATATPGAPHELPSQVVSEPVRSHLRLLRRMLDWRPQRAFRRADANADR